MIGVRGGTLAGLLLVLFLATTGGGSAAQPAGPGIPFDGVSEYAVVDADGALDADALSLAVWVKFRSTDGSQVFVNQGTAGTGVTFYLFRGKVRMLVEYAPGTYSHADCPAPAPGEWVHFIGTYDGTHICIYRNGALVGRVRAQGRAPLLDTPLFLGALSSGERHLNGWLEDIMVWNRALPDTDAQCVYERTGDLPAELRDGQLAWWSSASRDGSTLKNRGSDGLPAELSDGSMPVGRPEDGYRGIWYANQPSADEYKFKYSGGLGTYCAKHIPLAVYCDEANKTFFCYGGTAPAARRLWHMVAWFDHTNGTVPQPTFVLDKNTDDAHDNPVLQVDRAGTIWLFSSSHGTGRPSYIHRSTKPYDVSQFERVVTTNFSYPQAWYTASHGFVFLQTLYHGGRFLHCTTSPDGVEWSAPLRLAHVDLGHYQVSWAWHDKVGTAFNYHPAKKGLNWRTNVYYMESGDGGRTWQTADGSALQLPLDTPANAAMVHDYAAEHRNVYMKDLNFDAEGRPVVLYLTSGGYEAGPKNDPRIWQTARWTGRE